MEAWVGVHSVAASRVPSLVARLRRAGWKVYALPAGADDGEGFIRAAAAVLPLDPPLHAMKSWDALSDSLWGGLDRAGDSKVAIAWADAGRLRERSPGDFAIAVEVLADLVDSLGDPDATAGRPVQLAVLVGTA